MSTYRDQAVVAASKSLFPTLDVGEWDEQSPEAQRVWMKDVGEALDAAEEHLREQISMEVMVEYTRGDYPGSLRTPYDGVRHAAAIIQRSTP